MAAEQTDKTLEDILDDVKTRNPGEEEFLQAVTEVAGSLGPLFEARPELLGPFARAVEPERVVMFRVAWVDDEGKTQVNRGYRVLMSTSCGAGKGGLRFHPSVNLSILKFLAFEQVAKNSLTSLPLGGSKGGSDFDPRGKSDREVQAFCQAFMSELYHHIGADTDVPAGDIGVGGREIGFLEGQYKRLTRDAAGVLTGKGHAWGGSLMRPEATGFGLIYLATHVVESAEDGGSFEGKKCLVSGSGNVALHAAKKLMERGAKVVSLSDSGGVVHIAEGLTDEILEAAIQLKTVDRGRISQLADSFPESVAYTDGGKPWDIADAEYAFPCATQNELVGADAETLISNGIKGVFEGANMPCDEEAIAAIKEAGLLYTPGKASNAGGVAVSGLEMAQNAGHVYWEAEEVDSRLKDIMKNIHDNISSTAEQYGLAGDLQAGANIAGMERVLDAMLSQGVY